MSLEVLKVIILACQVSAGGERIGYPRTWERVDRYQKKCQQELIKCYEDSGRLKPYAVRDCLMRRGDE